MKALKVFILGLIYGWLAKSVIDRIYQDNSTAGITRENAFLRERVQSLEAQLEMRSLETRRATPTIVQAKPAQTAKRKDDLKQIKGIGPAAERKLNEAGVSTFTDLARLTTQELQNILGSSKRVTQNAGAMISQAKKLIRQ